MGGSWSKWYLMMGTAETGQLAMMVVLMASSLLSIGYLMPVVGRAFFRPPPDDAWHGHNPGGGIHEAPLLCVLPPVLTGIGCLLLFLWADDMYRLVSGAVMP
jgi:multicomponent Na+:H+ antiporter subunit D